MDHDLGNTQNVTPSMHLINTPFICGKDNSGGHSSNVCIDDSFFPEAILSNPFSTNVPLI